MFIRAKQKKMRAVKIGQIAYDHMCVKFNLLISFYYHTIQCIHSSNTVVCEWYEWKPVGVINFVDYAFIANYCDKKKNTGKKKDFPIKCTMHRTVIYAILILLNL